MLHLHWTVFVYFSLSSAELQDTTCSDEASLFSQPSPLKRSASESGFIAISCARLILPFTRRSELPRGSWKHSLGRTTSDPLKSRLHPKAEPSVDSVNLKEWPAKWGMSPETAHPHSCPPLVSCSLSHWRKNKWLTKYGRVLDSNVPFLATERVNTRAERAAGLFVFSFREKTDVPFYFPTLARRATDEAWLLRAPDSTGSCAGQTLRGGGSEPQ